MLSLNLALPVYSQSVITLQKPRQCLFRPQNGFKYQTQRFPKLLAATNDDVPVQDEIEDLPAGLRPDAMPQHVAMIMDGNARWARKRGLLTSAGHEAGVRLLSEIIGLCCKWGIKVLTAFLFSSDNWTRPKAEVDVLMSLFHKFLESEMENFKRKSIRVSIIGDSSRLSPSLQRWINETEETTKNNTRLHIMVAFSYSGKYDIMQACRSIASKAKDGLIEPEDIDESLIEQELETNCAEFPSPDLLIRTGGELRISNFLLWQVAYTELFFAEELWPDFGKDEFVKALISYQQRNRRFGGRR